MAENKGKKVPSFTLNNRGMRLLRERRPDIVDCFLDGLLADMGMGDGAFAEAYWSGNVNEYRAKQRAEGKAGVKPE